MTIGEGMSFEESELKAVAEYYGVDIEEGWSNEEIIAEFEDVGVTAEMWEAAKEEARQAQEAVEKATPKKPGRPRKESAPVAETPKGPLVLVKMTRRNPTYETNGHRFTKDHPYIAMTAEEAQDIFDTEPEGFTLATPREVQEYYS